MNSSSKLTNLGAMVFVVFLSRRLSSSSFFVFQFSPSGNWERSYGIQRFVFWRCQFSDQFCLQRQLFCLSLQIKDCFLKNHHDCKRSSLDILIDRSKHWRLSHGEWSAKGLGSKKVVDCSKNLGFGFGKEGLYLKKERLHLGHSVEDLASAFYVNYFF